MGSLGGAEERIEGGSESGEGTGVWIWGSKSEANEGSCEVSCNGSHG